MRTIPATKGYVIKVDDEDYDRLSQYRWYAHNSGRTNEGGEKRPARRTGVAEGRKVLFLVHHVIRAPHGMVVDHINGDPWDNQKANLRICTAAENMKNRKAHKRKGEELAKGVYRFGSRYTALICSEGRRWVIGYFRSEREAAIAYDGAALALHGEFARLNYPHLGTEPRHPGEHDRIYLGHRDDADWAEAISHLRTGKKLTVVCREFGMSPHALSYRAKASDDRLPRAKSKGTA